jgi:hypothetical protein
MNERIKQFAQEAGFKVDWQHEDVQAIKMARYEKFAQLIVQECIDIIAPYTVRMSRPGEEYLHPILEIKQHFGVEE